MRFVWDGIINLGIFFVVQIYVSTAGTKGYLVMEAYLNLSVIFYKKRASGDVGYIRYIGMQCFQGANHKKASPGPNALMVQM